MCFRVIYVVQGGKQYDVSKTKIVEKIRKEYPKGTRVKLVRMDDVQAPPIGTLGTVIGVDDTASIIVAWDNGSSLNVIYNVDKCVKI